MQGTLELEKNPAMRSNSANKLKCCHGRDVDIESALALELWNKLAWPARFGSGVNFPAAIRTFGSGTGIVEIGVALELINVRCGQN
jgi:hypothetical protein